MADGVREMQQPGNVHVSRSSLAEAEGYATGPATIPAEIRELTPEQDAAWLGAARLLGDAGKLQAMDAVLLEARRRFPGSVKVAKAYASSPIQQNEPEEAVARWRLIAPLFPGQPNTAPAPLVELCDFLTNNQHFDLAEDLIAQEMQRFPTALSLAVRYGIILNKRRLWRDALARWTSLEERFPDNPSIVGGRAEAMWALKEDESALAALLDRLLTLQPHNITAEILYARLELRQNRAVDAVARLVAAEAAWPGNKNLLAQLNDARMQALVSADNPEGATDGKATAPAQDASDELFAQFESLGSGCEFGLLQRRFGIEPLGLLRWANITPQGLIDAMERRFAGIGDVNTTQIKTIGDFYVLEDRVYDLGMQTFIYTSTEAAETLLPKLCGRQRYLARTLMDDLAEGPRILVYKMDEKLSDDVIQRLWRAIRAYGDNTLLLVQVADEALAPGSLRVLEPGLMLGALHHFRDGYEIDVENWTKICTAARDEWTRRRSGQAA
jgi:hypothetical protein